MHERFLVCLFTIVDIKDRKDWISWSDYHKGLYHIDFQMIWPFHWRIFDTLYRVVYVTCVAHVAHMRMNSYCKKQADEETCEGCHVTSRLVAVFGNKHGCILISCRGFLYTCILWLTFYEMLQYYQHSIQLVLTAKSNCGNRN